MNRRRHITTILVFVIGVALQAQGGINGKWQGTTPSGQPIVLDVKVKAELADVRSDVSDPAATCGPAALAIPK